jgi:hypothetical protein
MACVAIVHVRCVAGGLTAGPAPGRVPTWREVLQSCVNVASFWAAVAGQDMGTRESRSLNAGYLSSLQLSTSRAGLLGPPPSAAALPGPVLLSLQRAQYYASLAQHQSPVLAAISTSCVLCLWTVVGTAPRAPSYSGSAPRYSARMGPMGGCTPPCPGSQGLSWTGCRRVRTWIPGLVHTTFLGPVVLVAAIVDISTLVCNPDRWHAVHAHRAPPHRPCALFLSCSRLSLLLAPPWRSWGYTPRSPRMANHTPCSV